jgi:hypothetical protein
MKPLRGVSDCLRIEDQVLSHDLDMKGEYGDSLQLYSRRGRESYSKADEAEIANGFFSHGDGELSRAEGCRWDGGVMRGRRETQAQQIQLQR